MNIKRVVANITSDCVSESVEFYTEFLGFNVAMDMGWIVTLASPSNPTAQISVLRKEESSPSQEHMSLSIEVDDVEGVHAKAVADGIPIVYPLTKEPWGVLRFHVVDPNGVVINVLSHVNRP